YAAIACSSVAVMPGSLSSVTSRLASTRSVGSLSGVPAARLPNIEQPARPHTMDASSSVRLGLGRGGIVGTLGQGGAVVQLGDRKTRLRGVGREAFLLAGELGHRQVLHLALLLAAQGRDLRDERADALLQRRDARGELLEARGLVALRLHERILATVRPRQLLVGGG